jgi:hypothetical protein
VLSKLSIASREKRVLFSSVAAMGIVQVVIWFVARMDGLAVLGFASCFFSGAPP